MPLSVATPVSTPFTGNVGKMILTMSICSGSSRRCRLLAFTTTFFVPVHPATPFATIRLVPRLYAANVTSASSVIRLNVPANLARPDNTPCLGQFCVGSRSWIIFVVSPEKRTSASW